jgi:hypothetical protein
MYICIYINLYYIIYKYVCRTAGWEKSVDEKGTTFYWNIYTNKASYEVPTK